MYVTADAKEQGPEMIVWRLLIMYWAILPWGVVEGGTVVDVVVVVGMSSSSHVIRNPVRNTESSVWNATVILALDE